MKQSVFLTGLLLLSFVASACVQIPQNSPKAPIATATSEGIATSTEITASESSATTGVTAQGEVVAEGLNGPMGVLVAEDGSIWVIDAGLGGTEEVPFINFDTGEPLTATYGISARVLRITPAGEQQEIVILPSLQAGSETLGGARLAEVDGALYATVGQWLGDPEGKPAENMAVVVAIQDGVVTPVANTWDFERANNPDGFILSSHPFGLAASSTGTLLVADAAGNTLLQVDPATGEIETLAVFDGMPSPLSNPERGDEMVTDPVPTDVVVGEDGTIYVSLLSGFPFLPGSAKVVQVSPTGETSDYATGRTMLMDLSWGPDGQLYAVEFGQFTEQGPQPDTGALVRVEAGEKSAVLIDGLSFPTALDFDDEGNAYVTVNGVGEPGSGQLVMFSGIAAKDASN